MNLPRFPGLILIDDRESRSAAYPFMGLPHHVGTVTRRLPTGDYSLSSHDLAVAVERKTLADLHITALTRRKPFTRELERMALMPSAHVVVETSEGEFLRTNENGKIVHPNAVRTFVAKAQDKYPTIRWHFCDGRRAGEIRTYEILLSYAESVRANG